MFRRRRLEKRRVARRRRRRCSLDVCLGVFGRQLQRLQFRPDIHRLLLGCGRARRRGSRGPGGTLRSLLRAFAAFSLILHRGTRLYECRGERRELFLGGVGASRRGGAVLARRRGLLLELRNSRLGSGRASLEPLTHRLHFLELGFQRRDSGLRGVQLGAGGRGGGRSLLHLLLRGFLSRRRALPSHLRFSFGFLSLFAQKRALRTVSFIFQLAHGLCVARLRERGLEVGDLSLERRGARRRDFELSSHPRRFRLSLADFPFHLVQRLRHALVRRALRFECHRLGLFRGSGSHGSLCGRARRWRFGPRRGGGGGLLRRLQLRAGLLQLAERLLSPSPRLLDLRSHLRGSRVRLDRASIRLRGFRRRVGRFRLRLGARLSLRGELGFGGGGVRRRRRRRLGRLGRLARLFERPLGSLELLSGLLQIFGDALALFHRARELLPLVGDGGAGLLELAPQLLLGRGIAGAGVVPGAPWGGGGAISCSRRLRCCPDGLHGESFCIVSSLLRLFARVADLFVEALDLHPGLSEGRAERFHLLGVGRHGRGRAHEGALRGPLIDVVVLGHRGEVARDLVPRALRRRVQLVETLVHHVPKFRRLDFGTFDTLLELLADVGEREVHRAALMRPADVVADLTLWHTRRSVWAEGSESGDSVVFRQPQRVETATCFTPSRATTGEQPRSPKPRQKNWEIFQDVSSPLRSHT